MDNLRGSDPDYANEIKTKTPAHILKQRGVSQGQPYMLMGSERTDPTTQIQKNFGEQNQTAYGGICLLMLTVHEKSRQEDCEFEASLRYAGEP